MDNAKTFITFIIPWMMLLMTMTMMMAEVCLLCECDFSTEVIASNIAVSKWHTFEMRVKKNFKRSHII